MKILDLTAPIIITCVMLYASGKGIELYPTMLKGAEKGLQLSFELLPALCVLFPAIYLLKASGLPELLSRLASPLFSFLGIPPETSLLMLLRPLSGSGALAVASDLIESYGPDSLIGRTAAVMIGSSETTFYVIAVYFAAAGVKKTRWAIPAAPNKYMHPPCRYSCRGGGKGPTQAEKQ